MGTYTANYNLYLPTVGEQGWGDLMNGNLTTIDTTMKSLSNRIGTLETETDVVANTVNGFGSRITALEGGNFTKIPTLSYEGYYDESVSGGEGGTTRRIPFISSPFPFSGVVSVKRNNVVYGSGQLVVLSSAGIAKHDITTTQTEYSFTNAYSIYFIGTNVTNSATTLTIGIPVFVNT